MKVNAPLPLSPADVALRRGFEQFVLDHAEPWHREYLGRMYRHWNEYNRRFFRGAMFSPYMVLSPPSSTKAIADCSPVSSFGGRAQYRMRESLLLGTHPRINREADPEGRMLYVLDAEAHEMIHQWQYEVSGIREDSYHGHGPVFCAKCNEIGRELGLPPVNTKTRNGVARLPNCAQWPTNVRPDGYYLGAVKRLRFVPPAGAAVAGAPAPAAPGPVGLPSLSRVRRLALRLLGALGPAEIDELVALLRAARAGGV